MSYREKADLVREVSRELASFTDPRGETKERVGLVETELANAKAGVVPAAPATPKLQA